MGTHGVKHAMLRETTRKPVSLPDPSLRIRLGGGADDDSETTHCRGMVKQVHDGIIGRVMLLGWIPVYISISLT